MKINCCNYSISLTMRKRRHKRRSPFARYSLAGIAVVMLLTLVALTSCVTAPPTSVNDVCHIFEEKGGWYKAAKKAGDRWRSPIPVMMAIMHQESRFNAKAKPPRRKILWIFPGPRISSAYGYSQAKNTTWDWYLKSSGNRGADRDDFADAIDFVGWYNNLSQKQNGIQSNDAYHLYLAYHEGHGGFSRQTYRNKDWLLQVARRVDNLSRNYTQQLARCEEDLQSPWWWPF